MPLAITRETIRSSCTAHVATSGGGSAWEVSWLPGMALTQAQAVTAMLLAEVAAVPASDRPVLHVASWAAELGLTAEAAVGLAAQALDGGRRLAWAALRRR